MIHQGATTWVQPGYGATDALLFLEFGQALVGEWRLIHAVRERLLPIHHSMAAPVPQGVEAETPARAHQPCVQSSWVIQRVKMLEQPQAGLLEDISSFLLIQPESQWHGIDQALVAAQQPFPGGDFTSAASSHQLLGGAKIGKRSLLSSIVPPFTGVG